jgi:hypothetical protein
MTYIFTAPQLGGIIQQALETDDPLVLENVAFLAELFYQDCKDDIKELTDQPWPERLVDTIFEAYDYGVYEQDIRTNIDDLPQDFVLSTITVKQIMIIQKLLASILEQCNERTVFEIVDYVANNDNVREAYDSDSKEIVIDIK